MIRVGVDVGGTNTDAVVMDGTRVLAWAKTTSTPDATSGLVAAAREALARSGAGDGGRELAIDFQNEHLIARERTGGGRGQSPLRGASGRVVASVPDLVCIVASDDAEPIGTELLRYGYRVTVLGLPAHPLLRTPEALAAVGPRAFGYDVDFTPLSD